MNSLQDQIQKQTPTSPVPEQHAPEERARRRAARRRNSLLVWLVVVLAIGGASAWFGWSYFRGARQPFNGPVWQVKREALQIMIVERGALESAENSDIV